MMTLNEVLESKTIGKRLDAMKISLKDVFDNLLKCDTDDYRVKIHFETKLFEVVLRDIIRAEDGEFIKTFLDNEPKMEIFICWLTGYCDSIYKIGNDCYYHIEDWTVTINKDIIFSI